MSLDFDAFFRSQYPNVYRACLAFTGNRESAVDATQEAFSRAFARWRRLSREEWTAGWVMTTALNICRRSPSSVLVVKSEADDSADDGPETRADIERALRALPLRQRQAILLHYLADLPINVVARLMQTSEGTVKTHLSRGRLALSRSLLQSEGGP